MKSFLITTVSFLFIVQSSFSQTGTGASLKPPPNIMSPEAANLGKYGTYNVNQYTGTPGISIPVYEIKDKELSIPISLSYDASGFIPNKNSGYVGLNWNLSAGGAITRVVNGVPDEKYTPAPTLDETLQKIDKGYIYGIQQGLSETCGTPTCIESLTFLATTFPQDKYPTATGLAYEHNPDIFSFNFLGHSGTFVMGTDGNVKVASDRRYKVDLSLLQYRDNIATDIGLLSATANTFNNAIISSISITSDDGFKFYFGGKLSALEISFSYPSSAIYNENSARAVLGKSGVISAWHLVKVVTPDGREINFDYGTYSADEIAVLQNLSNPFAANVDTKRAEFLDIKLFWNDYKTSHKSSSPIGNDNTQGYSLDKSLIKQVYLKKIITPLYTATFSYSTKNETEKFYLGFENSIDANSKYFTRKLDKIEVRDNLNISMPFGIDGDPVLPMMTYKFEYDYFGTVNTGYRLFLKKMIVNNENIHQFAYHTTDQLPHPLTPGIDKWGYYNGQISNTKLIGLSGANYGTPGEYETDFSSAGQNRQPAGTILLAQMGLLKTITYPTGGTTQFDYEPHTYRKVLKKKVNALSGNSVIPEWEVLSADQYAGGARIKTITTNPGVVINYKYNKDIQDDANQPSNGLLTDFGVYRIYADLAGDNFDEKLFDQNISKANTYSESHISYSEVKETIGDGSAGFNKYQFTTHLTNPDNYYFSPNAVRVFATYVPILSYANQLKRLARYSSRSVERGKLKKKEVYNSSRVLVSSQEYTYNEDAARFNNPTPGYEQIHYSRIAHNSDAGWFYNAFRIYNYHDQASQTVEKMFSNGVEIATTTTFTYKANDNPLLFRKTVAKSDGSVVKTEYTYPEDMGATGDYPVMVNRFMVAPVVREKTFINVLGDVLQSTVETVYDDVFNNTLIIKPVQQTITNHTVTPASVTTGMNLLYYPDGSVKQSYKQDDVKTLYLWDYEKHFAVAEIINANDIADVAYSSFETAETGGWSFNADAVTAYYLNPTGIQVFNLNYLATSQPITKTGLSSAKQYTVSFWFKGSSVNCNSLTPVNQFTVSGWEYREYLVSGAVTVTITGTGFIDEIRCYPKGSFMSTNIYFPLNGLGAKCDLNNQISYYEYDFSARLSTIRDKDRNILKKLCYNYFGQPEYCDFTTPSWEATGQTRCKTCELSTIYTYNILQREEKDINTNSATYNQLRWVDQAINKACGNVASGWTATGNYRCVKDANNQNTGEQEGEQVNLNPCHSLYNQTRWMTNGTNLTACPACTASNCTGNDKKCINGVCETGIWSVASFVKRKVDYVWVWDCTYRYCFSDGSQSTYSQVITHSTACTINCFF